MGSNFKTVGFCSHNHGGQLKVCRRPQMRHMAMIYAASPLFRKRPFSVQCQTRTFILKFIYGVPWQTRIFMSIIITIIIVVAVTVFDFVYLRLVFIKKTSVKLSFGSSFVVSCSWLSFSAAKKISPIYFCKKEEGLKG